MDAETLNYSIRLGGLVIEIDVSLELSLKETQAYQGTHGPNFAFVAGTMWVKIGEARHLIASEFHSGNIVEFLKMFEAQLASPPSFPSSISDVMRKMGPCAWMATYWKLVEDDRNTAGDEKLYDLVFPFCLIAERDRCVAIFNNDGVPTIEITASGCYGDGLPHCLSQFDPRTAEQEIRQTIITDIRQRMRTH